VKHRRPITIQLREHLAAQAKCFHPTKAFIEFKKEKIEQSIPESFREDRLLSILTELGSTWEIVR
jgi:hypothetical protein